MLVIVSQVIVFQKFENFIGLIRYFFIRCQKEMININLHSGLIEINICRLTTV
jgi:hypothetical protein